MTTLSAITFAAPMMFLGLGLLSLPVAAHLLNRRARRRVIFPTILLLHQSSASQSQLFKLRRLLLLLLRCLIVLLVVAAFARPMWRDRVSGAPTQAGGTAAVLIMDLSASAGQRVDGVAAIEGLRAATGRVIDSLARGDDVANLIYATARPQAVLPSLTGNLEVLQQTIDQTPLTADRADLPAALALAGKLLAEHHGDRLLVIFSDLQATNWTDVQMRVGADQPLPSDTQIRIVPPAPPAPDNLGLHGPTVYPQAPVADQPVQVAVQLSNFTHRHLTATVALSVDGVSIDSQSVALGPWQQREVIFTFEFESPGDHEVEFSLPSDALESDNRACLVAHAVDRVPALVIGDDDPDEPGTATYFTVRALAPRNGREDRFEVRHVTSGGVANELLEDAAVIFVSYTGILAPATLEALHRYMLGGGGVVFFCGHGPVAKNLTALDKLAAPDGLLPWQPGSERDLTARGDLLFLADGDWRSTLLRRFDDRSQHALAEARFGRVWSVREINPKARVLLKYSDGSVAVASRAVGAGSFVMANFTPALGGSDLGKHGAFVALMQSMAESLQTRLATRRTATISQPTTVAQMGPFDPDGPQIGVLDPDGHRVDDFDLYGVAGKLTLTINRPRTPGFYRVMQAERKLGAVAANVDPRESDLRRLDAEVLEQQLESHGINADVHDLDGHPVALRKRGNPLWGLMLAVALFAIGLELALLGYWRR